jgi:hypothetical protein
MKVVAVDAIDALSEADRCAVDELVAGFPEGVSRWDEGQTLCVYHVDDGGVPRRIVAPAKPELAMGSIVRAVGWTASLAVGGGSTGPPVPSVAYRLAEIEGDHT